MAEETRNLCAQIPSALHARVRQEQEKAGRTLSEYMTQLIAEFYQMKEENQNMNVDTKTVVLRSQHYGRLEKLLVSGCQRRCIPRIPQGAKS